MKLLITKLFSSIT